MAQIGLIDYGCGNIRSVAQAFDYLGHDISIHETAKEAIHTDYLVLPGVGAFEKASKALKETGFDELIRSHIQSGKPFLGICVGMQILMNKGFEFGEHDGLSLIKGSARALNSIDKDSQTPHIGWAPVKINEASAFRNYNLDGEYFYFNHSYVCAPEHNEDIVSSSIVNNNTWPALLEKDNIFGIQCHPEKSHVAGLRFLTAFSEMK